jgi:hypothetical protein
MSHKSGEVINKKLKQLETIHGPFVGLGHKQNSYLGMDLTFEKKGLKISLIPYIQVTIDAFPDDLSQSASTPLANHLFDDVENPSLLNMEKAMISHHTVAKLLWM